MVFNVSLDLFLIQTNGRGEVPHRPDVAVQIHFFDEFILISEFNAGDHLQALNYSRDSNIRRDFDLKVNVIKVSVDCLDVEGGVLLDDVKQPGDQDWLNVGLE